jgi:ribosomal protein S18 acetylase RimI-like enzyme
MRLERIEKTQAVFDRIWEITEASFTGVELPPKGVLETEFGYAVNSVFTDSRRASWIQSYALLSEKFGEAYIWSIATAPTSRGCGFASHLLDEIEDYARTTLHQTGIGLSTNVNNPAQKLYFDHGYRVERFMPGYYGKLENGLFMRRPLGGM